MNTAYINKLREEYIENHTRQQIREALIEENNIELRDVKGYHGREILELLQNADDAYQKSIDHGNKPNSDLNVEITYQDECLTISNTGTFFDEDGIKAIVQGNNSPKKGKYIGNKGTGFRSILNWAKVIRIYSGEFAVQFSREFADNIFTEIKDKPQIAKQLEKNDKLYIPMLAVPEAIPHNRSADKTTIEVTVDLKKTSDEYSVERQLDSIDLRILLFLPNISKIRIVTDSKRVVYQRSVNDSYEGSGLKYKNVILSKIVNDVIEYSEKFKLFNTTVENAFLEDEVYKDVQLAVAVPIGEKFPIDHLYSFFPLLDTDAPFDCIMHATYSLGDHRNTLIANDINKKIGQYQLNFLFTIAEFLSKEDPGCAQSILTPKGYYYDPGKFFPAAFSRLSLEDYYVKGLGDLKIFQTVTGDLVSINDCPRRIESKFPECFNGEPFRKLLTYEVNVYALIHLITNRLDVDIRFSTVDLCQAINRCTDGWTIPQQVEVFIWWNKNGDKTQLPQLLKTRYERQTDRWLRAQEDCYFLEGDFDSIELPNWVKITALADEYQQELVKQAELQLHQVNSEDISRSSSIIRQICQSGKFPCLNFKYRDRSHALPVVNSSVTNYTKAVELVKWIWKYKIHPVKEAAESVQKINYKFPSADGDIISQDKLYFGSGYGYPLSESLFSSDYKEFPALDVFGVPDCESEEFQKHFREFGIAVFPRIELIEMIDLSSVYDRKMKRKIEATGVYDHVRSTYIDYCKYRLPYIKELPDVLQKLSMSQVIEWIMKDPILKEYLGYDVYPSSDKALVRYHGNNQNYGTLWGYSNAIDNYILYTFKNTSWMVVGGEKKSPIEVLDAYTSRINERYKNFLPVLTINDIEAIATTLKVSAEDVRSVLGLFSFPKYVTELSSDSFYGLMLALQETDILNEDYLSLSRAIYRIIEQPDFTRDFEESVNKKRFFEEGKLLVKYKGKLQYWLANETMLPSTRIIKKEAFPIVEKGIRTNSKNFVRVFGCKEYCSDYELLPNTAKMSDLNIDFQSYFLDFIKYAKAFSEKNDTIGSTISKLKVTLVKSISVKENEEVLSIDNDYTLLRRSVSDWYIVINALGYDRNRMSECVENIFANIANTSGFDVSKIGELFRTIDTETRKFLIVKEFGSLDVINEDFGINHIQENFYKTLEVLGKSKGEEFKIDFDEFASLENTANLVRFFRSINVDLDTFRDAGFVYPLDVREYWRCQMEEVIRCNIHSVKSCLYRNVLNGKLLKSKFIEEINAFENYCELPILNSVFFDPKGALIQRFGSWAEYDTTLSVDDIYSTNFARMNPNKLYSEVICNDMSAQTMIYFGEDDDFSEWLKIQEKKAFTTPIDYGLKVYEKYKDVVPETVDIVYSRKPTENVQTTIGHKNQGVYSMKKAMQRDSRLKEIGNSGELLIYNYLCKKYGRENVEPRSEAFVQLGIIPAGLIKPGCDLAYREGDKTIYVEVKTGENNRIYLSPGELEFAHKHADNYRLFYVTDINNKQPKFSVLEPKFWDDPRYKKREIIESIEFTF